MKVKIASDGTEGNHLEIQMTRRAQKEIAWKTQMMTQKESTWKTQMMARKEITWKFTGKSK
jgi:hypothetical protein